MAQFIKGFMVATSESFLTTHQRDKLAKFIGYRNEGKGADGYDSFFDMIT